MSNLKTVTPETISLETLRKRIDQLEDLQDLTALWNWQEDENNLAKPYAHLCSILRRREYQLTQRSQDERIRDILSH